MSWESEGEMGVSCDEGFVVDVMMDGFEVQHKPVG